MKFNIVLALGFMCCLSACSNTYLHLISKGYSEEQVAKIISKLEKLPVKVVRSTVSIPATFPFAVVATNPNFTDLELLRDVESILLESGIKTPSHLTFAQGKHFYNANNLGLYLQNNDNIQPEMPSYLRTQYCQFADATIMFGRTGEFVLEYEKGKFDEGLALVNGRYSFDGKVAKLTTESGLFQAFILRKEMKVTQFGERPADVFKPTKNTIELPALNCQFLIIYMD